jgi:hypothetical protein
MAQNDTFIIRVALNGKGSIYRDLEIEPSKSLYRLAEAIVAAFDFDFDHAFGFYSGDPFGARRKHPYYELFADRGEGDVGARSVKKTKIAEAFPTVGHSLLFLFDYGDEWRFKVKLKGTGRKTPKTRYPRVVASNGEAPKQYEYLDEMPEDEPVYATNLLTGERIKLR